MKKRGVVLFVLTAIIICFVVAVWNLLPNNLQNEESVADRLDDKNVVDEVIEKMSLEEKIYQMMFVTPESITGMGQVVAAGETTKNALEKYPVGGIIYFTPNMETPQQVKEMISNSQEFSKIKLFIGVDEEGGRVSRIGDNPDMGMEKMPDMASVGSEGDTEKAYNIGKKLASNLSELGFNIDFAPVADIITNPNNTEIGDRSFGTDGEKAAPMVESVVKGLEENGVSAVLKHFPGHGSTENNSHNGYSESTTTIEHLRENEFIPFKRGIDAGADFVMISHATFVNVTEEDCPASLSKEIITDILINELGFEGIVITDSFSMGAVTENYTTRESVVKAVNAGVNMILMPADVDEAFAGIKEGVETGKIDENLIDISVKKILKLKSEKGLL